MLAKLEKFRTGIQESAFILIKSMACDWHIFRDVPDFELFINETSGLLILPPPASQAYHRRRACMRLVSGLNLANSIVFELREKSAGLKYARVSESNN